MQSYSMYEYYAHPISAFDKINIYKYLQFVTIVKQSQQQGVDYKFVDSHKQKKRFHLKIIEIYETTGPRSLAQKII